MRSATFTSARPQTPPQPQSVPQPCSPSPCAPPSRPGPPRPCAARCVGPASPDWRHHPHREALGGELRRVPGRSAASPPRRHCRLAPPGAWWCSPPPSRSRLRPPSRCAAGRPGSHSPPHLGAEFSFFVSIGSRARLLPAPRLGGSVPGPRALAGGPCSPPCARPRRPPPRGRRTHPSLCSGCSRSLCQSALPRPHLPAAGG